MENTTATDRYQDLINRLDLIIADLRRPVQAYGESNQPWQDWQAILSERETIADRLSELLPE